MKKILWTLPLLLLACKENQPSGMISSATLESDIWKISATVQGTLTDLAVREGDSVSRGQIVAWIDSIPLVLKLAEIEASKGELGANLKAREAETHTLGASDAGIQRELDRTTQLVQNQAIPAQRKDDLVTQSEVSKARISASQSATNAMRSKYNLIAAQEATLRDQIHRCQLSSPAAGRVLVKYRNAGEIAIPGRPLYEVGRTDSLYADFFITQTALAHFRLGQALRIRLDQADGQESFVPAKLIWIADEAEFTPKGVQTREARNELVFRARAIAANNHGELKRGMPVEVWENP